MFTHQKTWIKETAVITNYKLMLHLVTSFGHIQVWLAREVASSRLCGVCFGGRILTQHLCVDVFLEVDFASKRAGHVNWFEHV